MAKNYTLAINKLSRQKTLGDGKRFFFVIGNAILPLSKKYVARYRAFHTSGEFPLLVKNCYRYAVLGARSQ